MENDITKLQMQDLERRVQMLEDLVNAMIWEPFGDDPEQKVHKFVRESTVSSSPRRRRLRFWA